MLGAVRGAIRRSVAWDLLCFYARCARRAIKGKLGFAQVIAFVAVVAAGIITFFVNGAEDKLKIWLWVIPLAFLIAAVVIGLILAPYQEYQHLAKRLTPSEGDVGSAGAPILPDSPLHIEFDGDPRFAPSGTAGYPTSDIGTSLFLRMPITLEAPSPKRVESLELEVLGKRIPTDWKSRMVGGGSLPSPAGGFMYFVIPDSVNPGEHSVKLIAFADGKPWRSPDYTVDFPDQTQT